MRPGSAITADLLRVAARSRRLLNRAARARIAAFLRARALPDGGYRGRGAAADVYYTLFGLLAGAALRAPPDRRRHRAWLDAIDPADLDLPHLAAWVASQRLLRLFGLPRPMRRRAAAALAAYRSPDGAFSLDPGGPGSAYGLYLAVIAGEGLGRAAPAIAPASAAALLDAALADPSAGLSPLAAATLALQALGGAPPVPAVLSALSACRRPDGGFAAHRDASASDLLSTAVGALTQRRLGAPLRAGEASAAGQFVQSLWDDSGGFRGAVADALPDCEYTAYALLALGALEP
ncbi:MAG: hypothetical protein GX595_09440 [Lentisphaerae bacterium]|nr:hypothetical protein [Lentisphaerota bacterium]